MQKITPFLWFDHEAEEAAGFYTSLFERSRIVSTRRYGDAGPGPKGEVMTLSFELEGQAFMALNGGPEFSFTPAVSFFVTCRTVQEVDVLWGKLSERGKVYMELQKYPFSEKFGWLSDRFGVSWQLSCDGGEKAITPSFLFVGERCGRAEEAMKSWGALFEHSGIEQVARFGAGEDTAEGAVRHARFTLCGQKFMAGDSGLAHQFTFTPAISFFVSCETQGEIDKLWEKLSKGGRTDQCGWLQDAYGVSWQIVPSVLGKLLDDPDPVRSTRVMKAMLGMTRLDIKGLEQASRR